MACSSLPSCSSTSADAESTCARYGVFVPLRTSIACSVRAMVTARSYRAVSLVIVGSVVTRTSVHRAGVARCPLHRPRTA